jgi:outer membrane protein TolC
VALRLPYLNQLPALPATHTEIRRLAWSQSHELRALRAEVSAQQHTLTSNQALLLPQVGLSLERDQTKNVRGDNGPLTDNRLLVTATWQASLAGKEGYQAAAAAAELGNRQAKLTEHGERLMQQVDADFALLQSTSLRVAASQAEELASAAVVKAVDEQLQTGRMGSLLEVLDAYERHFAARQRLIQTLSQQMQSQAQLLARMGMLSTVEDATLVELAAASASIPPAVPALPSTPQPVSSASTLPLTPPASPVLKTQPIPAPTELSPTELVPDGEPRRPNSLNP